MPASLAARFVSGPRSRQGAAGIEFALVASILAILLVGVVDMGAMVSDRRAMGAAVRAGAQYFMVGGVDLGEAGTVIQGAWSGRDEAMTLGIDKLCYCAAVLHGCTANCADGALPAAYYVITATTTFEGVLVEAEHVVSETIRIR